MTVLSSKPASAEASWLDRLAHDLRGPLSPIRSAVQMLRNGSIGSEATPQMLELIDRQLDELVELIDDLADRVTIERDRFRCTPRPTDLRPIVDAVAVKLSRRMSNLGVSLTAVVPDSDVEVQCDGTRIAQLLGYLIRKMAAARVDAAHIRIELHGPSPACIVIHTTDGEFGIAAALRDLASGGAAVPVSMAAGVARTIAQMHELTLSHTVDADGIHVGIAFPPAPTSS
ncbi:MAG: histidine kinase dimerization/phospho-acceptor domain-containing protein [Tahibacter sp.]